jgi:hypothetical protein
MRKTTLVSMLVAAGLALQARPVNAQQEADKWTFPG